MEAEGGNEPKKVEKLLKDVKSKKTDFLGEDPEGMLSYCYNETLSKLGPFKLEDSTLVLSC